jgi:DNA ligase 1
MPELQDGESVEVQGSSGRYELKNVGGVYSCTCPAWRHQSQGIEKRTCKHLRAYRGEQAETARVGAAVAPARRPREASGGSTSGSEAGQTRAPPVLLAHVWENDVDPAGWWMSEKLDGVRAYWDGTQFISRLGNLYCAPGWFVEGLPSVPLDGELWCGRKMFQGTVSIVRRTDRSDNWKQVSYLVFDAPAEKGPFEERIELCRSYFEARKAPHARWHEHVTCRGIEHLREELARVEALGGEGLMLRKPGSRYEACRSSTLLKVKTFHDAEARVLQHLPGTGKHKGRLGALLVEMPDGTRFNVGTGFSDAERDHPPPIGAIVTYRFQELSDGGVPRFPSYVGVRHDVAFPSTETRVATKKTRSAAPAPAAAAAVPGVAARPRSAVAREPATLTALRIICGRAVDDEQTAD